MSSISNKLIYPRPTVAVDQARLTKLIGRCKEQIFKRLTPEDYRYLIATSRLLSLRDLNPSKCTGEANIMFNDTSVPRCWRARAGVYRAEALMILGFVKLAKDQLIQAGRLLDSDDYLQSVDLVDRDRHEILEALIAWNIALGKINWGLVNPDEGGLDLTISEKLVKQDSRPITSSGKFLSAGFPSSLSLSALDLQYYHTKM